MRTDLPKLVMHKDPLGLFFSSSNLYFGNFFFNLKQKITL